MFIQDIKFTAVIIFATEIHVYSHATYWGAKVVTSFMSKGDLGDLLQHLFAIVNKSNDACV